MSLYLQLDVFVLTVVYLVDVFVLTVRYLVDVFVLTVYVEFMCIVCFSVKYLKMNQPKRPSFLAQPTLQNLRNLQEKGRAEAVKVTIYIHIY